MRGLNARVVVGRKGFQVDVELTIDPGQTIVMLGPNGAGKSTVVHALAGLIPLDHGHIELGDEILDLPRGHKFVPAHRRRIGVAFQDYLLFEHMSVMDNVTFGLTVTGTSKKKAQVRASELVERMGLTGLLDRRPSQLSGGQAQRVALARALAMNPRLLLLDEPLAALDIATRNQLRRQMVADLESFDGPRLIITHDPTDAFLLADQILVMESGRIVQSGTPQEIRTRPATPFVAAIGGTNLFAGHAHQGTVTFDHLDHQLTVADTSVEGPALVTIHPRAVALHHDRPNGSARNSWATTIVSVEPLGDTTRVIMEAPFPIVADVTPGAIEALGLTELSPIWVTIKATEISVSPNDGS